MKYRAKRGKIKYEHGMIEGLREFLESLQERPEIQAMIPGEIKPARKSSSLKLRRLTPTATGFKGICQSRAAVQEVFFVGDPEELKTILEPLVQK
jgi:hypothetical protein